MVIRINSCFDENGEDVLALNVDYLPRVMWDEERPKGQARVNCGITAGIDDELMFESDGSLMESPIYWRRPWEKLVGFRYVSANELYTSGFEKRVQQEIMNQGALLRIWLIPLAPVAQNVGDNGSMSV